MTPRRLFFTFLLFLSLLYATSFHLLSFAPEASFWWSPDELWQKSSMYGDAEYYLKQVESFDLSIAPYKYRVLPTLVVRATGLPAPVGYLLVNALCFVLVGVGFTGYLCREFSYPTALLGGVLAVTTVGMQGTLLMPMAEPMSYLAALVLWWALRSRKEWLFAGAAVFAVLVKEVFVVAAAIWLVDVLARAYAHPRVRIGAAGDGRQGA